MTLMPTWVWGDLDLTDSPFGIAREQDEVDFGAPQTATEALAQLLLDGEIELSPRASNRTISFTVYVDFTDLLAAAEAERLLALEADKKRNTLTFDPGDGYAPVTVFETFRAELSFVRSDIAEAQGLRRYDVTMKAYPHARSADLVETVAIATVPTPTVVTINAGDAVTGWVGYGALSDQGTYLQVFDAAHQVAAAIYTPAAPVNLTATPIVSLVVWAAASTPVLSVNSVPGTLIGTGSTGNVGQSRYYFQFPPGTTATTFGISTIAGTPLLKFNSLQRTDSLPALGTTRQKARVVAVEGSARTQGSLAVEHATSALGSTLVYTWPSLAPDYAPALRPRRASGGTTTADSALISGARDLLDTALVYDVPVSALIAGTHLLMARLKSDTVSEQSVTYTAQLRQGSNNVGAATTGAVPVPFGSTGTWRNVVLARLMLPPTDVPAGSTAVVRITIVATNAAASNIDLDEAWLFNTSVGDLSWVECGTAAPSAGGSSNRLWLNAATTDVPRPTIYRGFAADQSDAAYPAATEVLSFGTHRFEPPLMNVFTVTSNALDAAVTLEHYPRWQTHAAS